MDQQNEEFHIKLIKEEEEEAEVEDEAEDEDYLCRKTGFH